MAGCLVSSINRTLQTKDVTVFQSFSKSNGVIQRGSHPLTSASCTHFLTSDNPVAVVTAITNEIQTLARGQDLGSRSVRQRSM